MLLNIIGVLGFFLLGFYVPELNATPSMDVPLGQNVVVGISFGLIASYFILT
jgi:hypothetical protein